MKIDLSGAVLPASAAKARYSAGNGPGRGPGGPAGRPASAAARP